MRLKLFITLSSVAFDFAWLSLIAWLTPYWADAKAIEKILTLGRRADMALACHPDPEVGAQLLREMNAHLERVENLRKGGE